MGTEYRFYRLVVVVLLLAILSIVLDIKQSFENRTRWVPLESETVKAQDTGDVGQNNDKTVTQDEPNTTEDPNSPAINTAPDPEPVAPQPATTQTFQQSAPQITSVAGEQDVKTNPQSEVGGIEEANQLFANDEIGKQAETVEEKGISWGLIIGLLGILVACLIFGILILKKKKDDEDSPKPTN